MLNIVDSETGTNVAQELELSPIHSNVTNSAKLYLKVKLKDEVKLTNSHLTVKINANNPSSPSSTDTTFESDTKEMTLYKEDYSSIPFAFE